MRKAIVLAGGQSRRMGRDKAALPIGDSTLLGRVISELLLVDGLSWVVVVGNRSVSRESALGSVAARIPEESVRFVDDRWPGDGPLGGLVTGLRVLEESSEASATSGVDPVAVVSCDLPNLTRTSLMSLFEELERSPSVDMVMSTREGRSQPLHSVMRLRTLAQLDASFMAGERRLAHAVNSLVVALVPDEAGSSEDADTPDDWRRLVPGEFSAVPDPGSV